MYTHSIDNISLGLLFCSKYPELQTIYGATGKMVIVHTKLLYYFAMSGLYQKIDELEEQFRVVAQFKFNLKANYLVY